MVISNYATRQKLANYLEKGILPKDLQDHRKGEYLEDFCLFVDWSMITLYLLSHLMVEQDLMYIFVKNVLMFYSNL